MSVSGRCLLSNSWPGATPTAASAPSPAAGNTYLSEETRPGQLYEIGENENGSYILNANDMCTAPFIDLICKAGVDSLKIEGRAETFYYVASVTAAYRGAATPDWLTRQTITLNCRRRCTQAYPHQPPALLSPASISAASRQAGRPTALPTSASGSSWAPWTLGKRHRPLPAARQMEPWGHAGGTVPRTVRSTPLTPEWIENEAGERVESTPHADGKIHHAHPGAAAHEPAAP